MFEGHFPLQQREKLPDAVTPFDLPEIGMRAAGLAAEEPGVIRAMLQRVEACFLSEDGSGILAAGEWRILEREREDNDAFRTIHVRRYDVELTPIPGTCGGILGDGVLDKCLVCQ